MYRFFDSQFYNSAEYNSYALRNLLKATSNVYNGIGSIQRHSKKIVPLILFNFQERIGNDVPLLSKGTYFEISFIIRKNMDIVFIHLFLNKKFKEFREFFFKFFLFLLII